MITAPNAFKVNRDAIKFLSKMMIGKPLPSSINALASLNEFSALLKEQNKLVEAKIFAHRAFKQMVEGLARQFESDADSGGEQLDWQTYQIMLETVPIIARRVIIPIIPRIRAAYPLPCIKNEAVADGCEHRSHLACHYE